LRSDAAELLKPRIQALEAAHLEGECMVGRWSAALLVILAWLPLAGEAADAPPFSNVTPKVEELSKQLADQSRPVSERLEIIEAMGVWATAQVRAPLLDAMKDPAPEVRAAAARALGWSGNREAIAALRERASTAEEPPVVRAAAVRSLGVIGDPSVRSLVVGATQDPDPEVRESALWGVTLGPLIDPADRTTYLIRLAEDPALERQLRSDAVRTLAGIKEDRVIDSLMGILEHEQRLTIELPPGRLTQSQVMALRYLQARDVPAWTAAALGALGARRALPIMLKAAEDPHDYFLRLQALQWLIDWNVAEALPVLVRRLEDPLPENRTIALIGLERRGDRSVIDSVRGRLLDPVPTVRAQAVSTLGVLGDATVRPTLEALQQKEPDPNVQRALEEALSRLPR
jgi:HEAT repeat protein